MKIKDSLFPYPILSYLNDDYVGVHFKVEYKIINDFSNYELSVRFDLNDEQLLRGIKDGDFSFLTHVECPETSFRKIYKTQEGSLIIPLDQTKITGDIEITSFVIANKDVAEYHNVNFNRLYGKRTFKIKKNNRLAVSPMEKVEIKHGDEDYQNIPSIIKISPYNEKFMDVDTDQELIYIKLPKPQYEMYFKFSNSYFQNMIMSAVILPCLVEVLIKMKKLKEEEEGTSQRWYEVIEKKFNEMNIDISEIDEKYSAIKLAQRILNGPINMAFEEIQKGLEMDIDEED